MRSIKKLTALQVATIEAPGFHADGGGLYLHITADGLRSWVFMTTLAEKPLKIDLGGVSCVSIARARRLAGEMREAETVGQDPRIVVTPTVVAESNTIPTFGAFALTYIASVESGWKNLVYQQEWRNTLRDHATLLMGQPIDKIGTDDLLAVLKPIWLQRPRTARRLRGRIERILEAAQERGFRPKGVTNPASWAGHLALLLPPPAKLTVEPHPALLWTEAPTFMAELRSREAIAARCLEFLILTAARRADGLGATWSEIDFEGRRWNVPAARMWTGVKHAVPLSGPAIALLTDVRPSAWQPDMQVFAINGASLSGRAISMLLRRMKRDNVTTHGFRSTFKDWAENANYPYALIDAALAHGLSAKAGLVLRHSDELGQRRDLMEEWAKFLYSRS